MIIEGSRFGSIEFTDEDVVHFSEGLVGFSNLQRFVLVSVKADSHFRWLQSLDEPGLAFLITDPAVYCEGYVPTIDDGMAAKLGLGPDTPRFLYATVSIPPGRPEDMTLNLVAPIVINAATRQAKQLVLEDDAYTIKHRVFPAADRSGEKQVA